MEMVEPPDGAGSVSFRNDDKKLDCEVAGADGSGGEGWLGAASLAGFAGTPDLCDGSCAVCSACLSSVVELVASPFKSTAAVVAGAYADESSVALLAFAVLCLAVVDVAVELVVGLLDELLMASVALALFVSEDAGFVVVASFTSSTSATFLVTRVFVAVALGCADEEAFFVVALAVVVALRTVFLGSKTVTAGSLTTSTGSSAITFLGLPGRFLTVVSAMAVVSRCKDDDQ